MYLFRLLKKLALERKEFNDIFIHCFSVFFQNSFDDIQLNFAHQSPIKVFNYGKVIRKQKLISDLVNAIST